MSRLTTVRANSYLGKEFWDLLTTDVVGKVVKTDIFSQGIKNGKRDIYLTVEWVSAGVIEGIVGDTMKFTLEDFEKRFKEKPTISERQK